MRRPPCTSSVAGKNSELDPARSPAFPSQWIERAGRTGTNKFQIDDVLWSFPANSRVFAARGEDRVGPGQKSNRPREYRSPQRAELFSNDQMAQHGARLASMHRWMVGRVSTRLLSRLAANQVVLLEARDHLIEAVEAKHRITPAGEWLLDNFYLVEEQIRTARRHLPKAYSRQLPSLTEGDSAGLPRVYDIALETIAHGDGRVDPGNLSRFVDAYQSRTPLRLGELWAIPIMLRLALIENLRQVAERVIEGRKHRILAAGWAALLTEIVREDPKSLVLVIADMARSEPPMSTPFVSELSRRLQGQGPALALPLTWIEQQLAESSQSIEQLVRAGNQLQAADQVSVANSIGSLRFLGTMDWREFVEEMSLVEHVLSEDPHGAYAEMDFTTRDQYRHVIEAIARDSGKAEEAVAQQAVDLAQANAARAGEADRTAHVGYFLVDRGRVALEKAVGARSRRRQLLGRLASDAPLRTYLGSTGLITLLLTAVFLTGVQWQEVAPWTWAPLGLLVLLAASQLAVASVNWLASLLVLPRSLPRMDFSEGIPPAYRTLVVVPTLLTTEPGVDRLVESLEVTYLANRDPALFFALLTDYRDAETEFCVEDPALLQLAQRGIESLNAQYAEGAQTRFFLFHRPRRWNPHDRVWMGHERKRGKLAELNEFLREGKPGSFAKVVGATETLVGVKYVITLDTDTELPRDAARQLVGAMAHPLHRPFYDAVLGRVSAGYGILQPRVSASLPGASRSLYARMNSGEAGIDPYTRAVSDVYQDAFQEGSFIGKGIYDLDAFEVALAGRFPENRILSHDLMEGGLARSGLLSDVQVYEDHPARYGADADRRHRWIRGDWQLVGWLLPRVRGADGRWQKNPLSVLSRWKLLDNLRRSLVPAALMVLLLLGWTVFEAPLSWTLEVLAILFIPTGLASLLVLAQRPDTTRRSQHLVTAAHGTVQRLQQLGFALVTLPHEAIYGLDAILRTLWRLTVSHKHLLDWHSSTEQEGSSSHDLAASMRSMAFAPLLALTTGLYLAFTNSVALAVASPFLALWALSPAIAWWVSQPLAPRRAQLSIEQTRYLGRIARATWGYFETYVGPDDHWLPPDNVQESRADPIAHRTSPTNMGLALLANLSAYDFGYIPSGALVERTGHQLEAMARLERHRGHFYNWYDTQSLVVLQPSYVSTVDSGNLAAHLLTLRAGLLELLDRPIPEPRIWSGLLDVLAVLERLAQGAWAEQIVAMRQDIELALEEPPQSLSATWSRLEQWTRVAQTLAEHPEGNHEDESIAWSRALVKQCEAAREDLAYLVPWIAALDSMVEGDSRSELDAIPTLGGLAAREAYPSARLTPFCADLDLARDRARARIESVERLAAQAGEFAHQEYGFLYAEQSRLLSVGYHVQEGRSDKSCYDLLASEARLGVFVAIAQGQLPQESWFALGRLLTTAGGRPVLMSWSGSMFEYLMPQLVMPSYENTLLDQTSHAAVTRQIEYGSRLDVPWGISESGYSAVDAFLNYQYRAFGVPGLGLKRGLDDDLVIAPYATALALMVAPEAACENLQRLSELGAEGRFGFFEAIDYTPARQQRDRTSALVRSHMVHHQGMSMLALEHLLLHRPMQRRFASDPLCRAALLLLQERVPRASALHVETGDPTVAAFMTRTAPLPIRVFDTPHTSIPEVQLLSNGRYHLMVTNAGGGFSRWGDLAVTRWREDGTRDPWGTFCYLRDEDSGAVWSNTHQPVRRKAELYEVIFSVGRAEFRRRDHGDDFDLETHTDIVVSPEDDIELRRIRITNRGSTSRTLEVTSYTEVVMAPAATDALHPAFSNLFVQTEIDASRRAILCTRRPRSHDEPTPWMFHHLTVHGAEVKDFTYETDRARFLGRGRTVAAPAAMDLASPLSGSQGSVLDPVVAIRCRITLEPGASANVDLVFGMGADRDTALRLVEKYQDQRLADRVFDLAWTHARVVLRQINASEADAQLYGRLAGAILHAHSTLRADSSVLLKNRRGQSGLWSYAISGDLPIVLLRIGDLDNIELVRQLIQAHAYWRLKGLAVDLVIWNEDRAGYRQALQDKILGLVSVGLEAQAIDRPGGIFVRSAEQISADDLTLFQTVARAILSDSLGSLEEQVQRVGVPAVRIPRLVASRDASAEISTATEEASHELILSNGIGGFAPDGREYVITTTPDRLTPAPWVNVLANSQFGTVISESGQAYTWGENAHSFRLTPWHNDPVSDGSGEALYLRDEETGRFWSPTPLPRRGATPYVTRHGFGYSVFEHTEEGIRSELWVYVALDSAVKFWVLELRNLSARPRRLSATGYVEWVLGDLRSKTAMHVVTENDPDTGALFARNYYSDEFSSRVAFFDVDDASATRTCDRTEFIGRNGSLQDPAALKRTHLSGRIGSGLDPCAAIQSSFSIRPGEQHEAIFRLGLVGTPSIDQTPHDAMGFVRRFRGPDAARRTLEAVRAYWSHTLGAVQVHTPDASLNVLTNGWLVYQALACRLWARSGYYQSGGAFGFRDQLQDAMALVHTEPRELRAQMLRCASRQFREGDVQHWWHPPSGRGVRTHCSDDFLWLPLATSRYVLSTGDTGVLDVSVPFLEGRSLRPDDESYYDLPSVSSETASLYEHCVRAIRRGLTAGVHGLPLIGSGDWNDGMNRVGVEGRGESVWLGFFTCEVLRQFESVARLQGDEGFAALCRDEGQRLAARIEDHGWDGGWYRRAYFDDGTPLGSASNDECQIDSLSQSWSILSGVGDVTRSRKAMEAVDARLVRRDHGLIQLLDPPFDRSPLDPGYIKGYVPGVRENGGQYTHAAVWAAMAFAMMGDRERAWELTTMINPVNHGNSPGAIAIYKAEPYVVAADVYAVSPHIGRGGWTWYTGSAGWSYRLIVESLLGLRLEVDTLYVEPCLPAHWDRVQIHYRYRNTTFEIEVVQTYIGPGSRSTVRVFMDGQAQEHAGIPLRDDQRNHTVLVEVIEETRPETPSEPSPVRSTLHQSE